jgi:hypothetical protein
MDMDVGIDEHDVGHRQEGGQAGQQFGAHGGAVRRQRVAAIGSLVMAFWANYPIALAPGMGLNAYFAYVVVLQMGFTWQAALGAVFISGPERHHQRADRRDEAGGDEHRPLGHTRIGQDVGIVPAGGAGSWLERTFALTAHGTTVRTELLAGLTTFVAAGSPTRLWEQDPFHSSSPAA